jgi:hypothetical protein
MIHGAMHWSHLFLPIRATYFPQVDRKLTMIVVFLLNTAYLGGVILVLSSSSFREAMGKLLLALAAFLAAMLTGFIFALPRMANTDGAAKGTLIVNQNLVEVSDWITKGVLALSVANYDKLGGPFDSVARAFSPGNPPLAGATMVAYFASGFLFGYILTRTYVGDIFQKYVSYGREIDTVADAVVLMDDGEIDEPSRAGAVVSPAEVAAAHKVQEIAASSDFESVRAQMLALAREYEGVRAAQRPSFNRTQSMERVMAKMRAMALAAEPMLPELSVSAAPGDRLAAIAILQMKPSRDYLAWLGGRFTVELPFIGYHAAVALEKAVDQLPPSDHDAVRSALNVAAAALADQPETDRYGVIARALEKVNAVTSKS